MKFKELALANAAGTLGSIYFVGCYIVAWLAPDFYKSIAESWMHMVNLNGLWKTAPDNFLTGFVSFVVVSWVTGYLFGWLYNKGTK